MNKIILTLLLIPYFSFPSSFHFNEKGELFGTVDNQEFSQVYIYEDLMRFQVGEIFWYINQDGVFQAENDLSAVSIHLNQVK